jgi:hypothetical protein
MFVERPDALGDDAVETADLINHDVGHSLTLVSKLRRVNWHGLTWDDAEAWLTDALGRAVLRQSTAQTRTRRARRAA